ncbi:MAG: hypothetical protein NTX17_01805 [Candidatus Eisenbacteria bacterium]|nr:hypothetical protein [Candidatus Eisenbacteria bacterium]
MSRVPVNPFALGAAFVERAVELGWVEVDADGRRTSYYVTDSGNEGLEKFGVKIEKAMHFTIIPERDDSAPKRRASSSMSGMSNHSMQPHRGPMPSQRGPMGGPPGHGIRHDGRQGGSYKGHERSLGPGRHDRRERRPGASKRG